MKRLMAMLMLALLIPSAGFAQTYYTLPEVREQTAQGWHQTYTDEYGRTIAVNTDVQVYGEDAAPVLRTQIAEYQLNAELLADDVQWSDGKGGVTLERNNPAHVIFNGKSAGKAMIVRRTFAEAVDMDTVYGGEYGAAITMREMTAHLTDILAAQGIDSAKYRFEEPKEFSVRCRMKLSPMEVTESAAYFAHFWQTMYGMPILAHVNDAYKKVDGPVCYPQMVLVMRSEEEYSIHMDELKETEKLAEDIPLCSFEKIKSSVEKEIQAGHVREVFGVRLGYVICNDPENPKGARAVYDAKSFYLMPMWVVDCIYMDDAKKERIIRGPADDELTITESAPAEREVLLINAQTGERLRSGNADYPGFIPWSDVK